ncbi:MAG: alpha/beta hydrolase-fold protein [Bryobacteraceae bacterium]
MHRLLLILIAFLLGAQRKPPEPPYQPSTVELREIRARIDRLASKLKDVPQEHDLRPDVEIYLKAAEWILRFPEEFYKKEYYENTLKVLDTGIGRADRLAKGNADWTSRKGRIARAYRSRVDGSVQPYGVVIPESYDPAKPIRLDVVLHGRAGTMNEVSFLAAHGRSNKPVPAELEQIRLEVFGRTNNAYRWSGETDVFEAIASVQERYNIDPDRIVLRGFSMGGAGAWHLGLHHPDKWAAVEAGAGFNESIRYAKLGDLPEYQRRLLHIYDAADYALNVFNLPTVGYGGEEDPQLQASLNIQEQLKKEGLAVPDLRVLFLVGPKTGHKWHPQSQKESDAFLDKMAERGRTVPDRIRFVTYTARYNECFWVRLEGLEKHYERAEVDVRREGGAIHIKTANVSRLRLKDASKAVIDGQTLPPGRGFEKTNGQWQAAGEDTGLRKRHGLQGPIDDAFMEPFLCVRPPEQFVHDYAKWLRADLRTKTADEVTKADMEAYNLVLWGEPGSNKLIAHIAEKLPIRWAGGEIVVGGRRFSANDHILAMIYPNPLNPRRYVVLNSGHTFGEREFRGTNALLFPRLGDYAIIRRSDNQVILSGFFDEQWRLPATKPGKRSPSP